MSATATGAVHADTTPHDRRQLVVVLGVLGTGLLLSEMDQAVFAAALPTIVADLGGLELQLWVGTGYVLAGALAMPVIGRLGDLAGRRQVFTAALVVFVLGSVLGGLAPTMPALIAARVVQGLGGGGLIILVEAVVADVVAPAQRALTLSGVGVVFAVAAVLGPPLGGALTGSVGWRWAFWLNVPLGLAAAVLAWRRLPRSMGRRRAVRLDVAGVVALSSVTVAAVLLVVWAGQRYPWGSPIVLSLATVVAVGVVVLVRAERRTAEPLLPLRLFGRPGFVVAVVAGAVLAVAMFGTVNYLPTYLQFVHGLTPAAAGLFLLVLVTGIGTATVVTGRVIARTGRPRVFPLVGAVLVSASLVLGSGWQPETSLVEVGAGLLILGLGIGCAWEVLVVVVQDSAGADDLGAATATNGFARELGVVLGTALVGRLFTAGLLDRLAALEGLPTRPSPAAVAELPSAERLAVARAYNDAFTSVLGWLVPLAVVSALALIALPRRSLGESR